ncbi:hypothetical protein KR222_009373 [Zaprionus bogoriensis]|nr:hypothetical protein KR222_009373 [Zaprionus bogoriensis]
MDAELPEDLTGTGRFQLNSAEMDLQMRKVQEHIDRAAVIGERKEPMDEHVRDTSSGTRFKRKLGTWIFESVGGYYLPTENVSKLSMKMQEERLVRDLIYAFSGVPSSHIRPDVTVEQISQLKTDQIDHLRFTIDESFSGAFRALANELLPLIGYYINVQSFIEDTIMSTNCGRALGMSLHKNMQQYFDVQAGLETQLHERKLSLQQLVQQLRPWLHTMEAYARLTSHVRRSELTMAQMLSLIHDHQVHFKSEGLQLLLTDVSHYYMKMVQLWTQKGVLYDVRGDFFIEDTSANAMSSTLLSPKQCCHGYWQARYRLHGDRLPSFLEPLSEQVFRAGKYLNILRQCNVHMKLMQAPLSYVPGDAAHIELIRCSYELPARKLLELMMENNLLEQHLRNLHGYFLLQNEDFTSTLLDKIAGQLQHNVDNLVPEKLQKLTLEALQVSEDPFSHMLHSELMDCDVATQLVNRLEGKKKHQLAEEGQSDDEANQELEDATDFSSVRESDAMTEPSSELPEPLSLSGYEAFALSYHANWPISLVIHEEPVEQLQLLHRLLFYLRYVQHQLKSACFYSLAKYNSQACDLRDRMSECLKQLEQHMLHDIVNPRWQALLSALEKVQLIDEVIVKFHQTLEKSLELCLYAEPITFVRSLFTLGQVCLNFCGLIETPLNEDFDATVGEYEEEFDGLLLGILELIVEMAKPSSSSAEDQRESCAQLLERLEVVRKNLVSTNI